MFLEKNDAFTLIEVLLTITIIGIIIIPIHNTYISGWTLWTFNQNKIDFQQVHRVIIALISPYIREATDIIINPSGDDKIRVYFSKKEPGTDPDDNYDAIAYGLNNNREFYYRKRWTDRDVLPYWGNKTSVISLKGNNLLFTYSSGILTLNMTLESEDGKKEYTFSDKFYPRLNPDS